MAWKQQVLSHVELTLCFGICNAGEQLFPPGHFQSVFQALLSQMVKAVSDSTLRWSFRWNEYSLPHKIIRLKQENKEGFSK